MEADIENTEIEYEFFENSTMNLEEICDSDGDVDLEELEFENWQLSVKTILLDFVKTATKSEFCVWIYEIEIKDKNCQSENSS